MNAKVVTASVELKKVYSILAEDVEEARTYGQTNPSGFAHRSLFRATFALIEGLSFQFRSVSLACAAAMPQLLTTAEVSLLKEEKYKLDNKGTPKASADFQKLLPNIFFSMRCYAKVHGATFEPDSHFGTDTGLAVQNRTESFTANAQRLCRRCYRETEGLKTKLSQYFARVWRVVHQHWRYLSDNLRSLQSQHLRPRIGRLLASYR